MGFFSPLTRLFRRKCRTGAASAATVPVAATLPPPPTAPSVVLAPRVVSLSSRDVATLLCVHVLKEGDSAPDSTEVPTARVAENGDAGTRTQAVQVH